MVELRKILISSNLLERPRIFITSGVFVMLSRKLKTFFFFKSFKLLIKVLKINHGSCLGYLGGDDAPEVGIRTLQNTGIKFFIMSTEFVENISDWRYDYADHKNEFDFFMRLVKWPKIAVKKCQNLNFKVGFQRQKSSESF